MRSTSSTTVDTARCSRYHDDSRALVRLDELAEVPRHGLRVVSDQDALLPGGECQDLGIAQPLRGGEGSRAEVDARLPPHEGCNDDLVEIRVRLEADHGYEASGVRRAAASFW